MDQVNRRGLLALGALGVGSVGRAHAQPMPSAAALLTPQTTEGPYYIATRPTRRDITEGLAGVPLDVKFLIVDTAGAPVRSAPVDIWHCNAVGRYSGFTDKPGQQRDAATKPETFLRGVQSTDETGAVVFRTVYPGWYDGRTTHIHFKVWQENRTVLTCQFFLPDALSEFLYTQSPLYKRERVRDTLNSTDGIAIMAGDRVLGAVREAGDHYLATLNVVVDRAADPVIDRPPIPGEGPPPKFAGGPPHGLGPGMWPPPGMGPPPPGMGPPVGPGGPPPGRAGGPGRPRPLKGEARLAALLPGVRPPRSPKAS